jgi:hypothetical protein
MPDPTAESPRPNARLRAVLAARGLDQLDVGRVLNLPASSVSRRFNGLIPWRFSELQKIAAHLGLKVADITDETTQTPSTGAQP